jgi:hypothetical protein
MAVFFKRVFSKSLSQKAVHMVDFLETKFLRIILGTTQAKRVWRIRNNVKTYKLYDHVVPSTFLRKKVL